MSQTIQQKPENTAAARVAYTTPAADLRHANDAYTLEVDMPGVPKDGVEIVFDDGQLTLVGHRPQGNTGYRRAFDLDEAIDADCIEASMEQGVLTLRLPKTEAAKPRRISVH